MTPKPQRSRRSGRLDSLEDREKDEGGRGQERCGTSFFPFPLFGQRLCGGEVPDPAESAILRKPQWKDSCILWEEDVKLQSV